MSTLALYAESVYRFAPQLRNKNLLADIETDYNAEVSPEDSASFLTSITQSSSICGAPLPNPTQIKQNQRHPEILAANILQTYGKTKAIDLVLKETWQHERGSSMFKFYAGVLGHLVGRGES